MRAADEIDPCWDRKTLGRRAGILNSAPPYTQSCQVHNDGHTVAVDSVQFCSHPRSAGAILRVAKWVPDPTVDSSVLLSTDDFCSASCAMRGSRSVPVDGTVGIMHYQAERTTEKDCRTHSQLPVLHLLTAGAGDDLRVMFIGPVTFAVFLGLALLSTGGDLPSPSHLTYEVTKTSGSTLMPAISWRRAWAGPVT